jgi:DNA-binding transcriptional regulator YiaG
MRVLPPSCEQIAFMKSAIGFTTKEFADLLGVPKSLVNYWMTGNKMPNSGNSLKLWELYEFPEVQQKAHFLSHVGVSSPTEEK